MNEAFARLVLPHLDAAYSLARWLVRDPAAAEDVVQDALLRGMTYFASFRGTNPRAWLLRIVRNVAYSRHAGIACEEPLDAVGRHQHLADAALDPEAALGQRDGAVQLERALATLAPELRECLVLRELEELSYRDIAAVTGVPVGTVMSRLFRARQSLIRISQAHAAKETAT